MSPIAAEVPASGDSPEGHRVGTLANSVTVPEPLPEQDFDSSAAPLFPEPLVIGAQPRLRSDPRGLPDDQFKVPDTVLDGADLKGLSIRAASLRGDEHRYFTTTRQDSMDISRIWDGQAEALIICVADGVGSEPLSHHGSAEACRLLQDEVKRRVRALFDAEPVHGLPELCQDLAEVLAQRMTEIADYLKIAPKALSTTLVAALIEGRPADDAHRNYVLFAVGDSTAFLLREGAFQPCFADQHDGVITSTNTNALPTSPGRVAAVRGVLRPGEMLMTCTDGMSNPMRNAKVAAQLAARWGTGRVPSLPEFSWQVSFRAKSYGDDRTAICVWAR